MTDATTLGAIAALVPDLALAATLTMFVVAAIRAWLPKSVGGFELGLDGGRVVPLVYASALAVVVLLTETPELSRELFASALAVTVFAMAEYTGLQFLRPAPEFEVDAET